MTGGSAQASRNHKKAAQKLHELLPLKTHKVNSLVSAKARFDSLAEPLKFRSQAAVEEREYTRL
jgi:hypothetical protein